MSGAVANVHVRRLILGAAALLLAWPTPYLEAIRSPNELVRVYLVRAIVDDRTIAIDTQVARYGPLTDMAARNGHLYSDKAPGLSLLGAPVYAALRAFRSPERITNRELVLWLRFLLLVVPTIVWMFTLSRWLEALGISRDLTDLAPPAYALGTPAFAYSLAFMGHQAAAWMIGLAMAAAWYSRRTDASGAAPAAAGFFSALAAITEYPAAPMIVAIAVLTCAGSPRLVRSGGRFLAAAAIPIVIAAAYHSAAFGGPLTTGYEFLVSPEFREIYRTGLLGISVPSIEALTGLTVGVQRGLLALSPWLVFVPLAFLVAADRPSRLLLAILAFDVALHLWVAAGYQYWIGGWSVGPRHIVPALPALAMLTILGCDRLRARAPAADPVFRGLLVASIAIMSVICVTYPGFPEELDDPLFQLSVPMLRDGQFSASVLSLAGVRSAIAMVPALAAASVILLYISVSAGSSRRIAVALLVAAAFFGVRWSLRPESSCAARSRAVWLRQTVWEPKDISADEEPLPDCGSL